MVAVAAKYKVRRVTQLTSITSPKIDGMVVDVECYADRGDGGIGTFVYDEDSNESPLTGMILGTGPGQFLRVYNDSLNIGWFGADPTGTEDSTSAFTACFAAAYALGVSHILVSKGTYKVSTAALPDMALTIEGRSATIQTTAAGSFAFTQANRRRVILLGLSFTGVGSGFAQNLTPSATQSYDAVIQRCSFVLASNKTAIKLTGSRESTIDQCYFETCTGIHLLQATNTHVIGSQFKNCAIGCYGDGSTTGSAYDAGLILTACTMLGCAIGVRAIGWDHASIINSMIDYCDRPVYMTNVDGASIEGGSYISGRAAYPAIQIDSDTGTYAGETTKHVTISTCHVIQHYDGATDSIGILIKDVTDVRIINNPEIAFWRNYGVKMEGTNTNVLVFDNYVAPLNPVAGAKGFYGTGGGDSTWRVADNTFTAGYAVGNTAFCSFDRNIGFNLRDVGSATILSGNTTINVTFTVALAEAPTRVFLCPRGNVGQPWPSNITTTGMTINIASAAGGNTQIDYDVFVPTT